MKKTKGILTGTLLVMALGMLTACGNNNNAADETGPVTEENNDMPDDIATDNNTNGKDAADTNSGADDAALDNGDTMSEGTVTDENAGTPGNTTGDTDNNKKK